MQVKGLKRCLEFSKACIPVYNISIESHLFKVYTMIHTTQIEGFDLPALWTRYDIFTCNTIATCQRLLKATAFSSSLKIFIHALKFCVYK